MSRYPMTDPITIPPFPLKLKKKSSTGFFLCIFNKSGSSKA